MVRTVTLEEWQTTQEESPVQAEVAAASALTDEELADFLRDETPATPQAGLLLNGAATDVTFDRITFGDDAWEFTLPSDGDLLGRKNGGGFYDAPELRRLYERIREKHPHRFSAARNHGVVFAWKAAKLPTDPSTTITVGKCSTVSGPAAFFEARGTTFFIWLNLNYIRRELWSATQVEAALYHELCHTGEDDKDNPKLYDHDFTGFTDELSTYGMWRNDLRRMGESVKQVLLPL
jgi:hypothetical protein